MDGKDNFYTQVQLIAHFLNLHYPRKAKYAPQLVKFMMPMFRKT